jgi:hypothetical protein
MGFNVGAFAGGLATGIQQGQQMVSDHERILDERQEREERQKIRDARSEFQKQMQDARAQFATGKLPGQENNLIEQPQAAAPVEQTDAQPRTAIAPVDGAAPAPAAPAAAPKAAPDVSSNVGNIFKNNGEGLYKNQKQANDAYWGRLRDITANYYEKTGQVEKLQTVDKSINEWRTSSYDELRKATAAAISTGDAGALGMASKLAALSGLGIQLDPSTGKYDAQAQTWKGVKVIGSDGKENVQDLSAVSLMSTIGYLSPEKLVEYTVGRQDKTREFDIKERSAKADETRANASVVQAKEYSRMRGIAQENQQDYRQGEAERKRSQQFTTELESELFRGKNPEMLDDTQRETITRTGSLARNLYGIPGNEKANAATLAGVARGLGTGKARVTELPSSFSEEQRANYLQADYAGARVLIPRSLIQQKQ